MGKKKKEEGQGKPAKSKPKKWGVATKEKEERAQREIMLEDDLIKTLKAEVPKMKMITLALIAQKYNLRISVAKLILKELIETEKIKPYFETNKLKVFVPA